MARPDVGRADPPVAAVVIAYRPQPDKLAALVRRLAEECGKVLVLDNGGGRGALPNEADVQSRIECIDLAGNRGLGAALNEGFRLAAAAGCRYVATFDQDSMPQAGQIHRLAAAHEQIERGGTRVGAVGPRIVDVRNEVEHRFMRRRLGWPRAAPLDDEFVPTDFVITSGAVVSIAAWRAVGGYDPALFVDYTDVDWCLRATQAGYRCFGIASETMRHELGGAATFGALGLTLTQHAPVRRYYYARNILLLVRRPYIPCGWKGRLVLGLAARTVLLPYLLRKEPDAAGHWIRLMQGVWHGLCCIGGPYPLNRS